MIYQVKTSSGMRRRGLCERIDDLEEAQREARRYARVLDRPVRVVESGSVESTILVAMPDGSVR